MNHAEAKQFLDYAVAKINRSAWTSDDAATELLKILADEQQIWREQERETGAFSGKFYL